MTMKLAPAIALALATVAVAQDFLNPTTEASWALLRAVAQDTTIPASPLKDHAIKSNKDINDWVHKTIDQMCKHRSKYEDDAERLAKFFDDLRDGEAHRMQKAVDDLP